MKADFTLALVGKLDKKFIQRTIQKGEHSGISFNDFEGTLLDLLKAVTEMDHEGKLETRTGRLGMSLHLSWHKPEPVDNSIKMNVGHKGYELYKEMRLRDVRLRVDNPAEQFQLDNRQSNYNKGT